MKLLSYIKFSLQIYLLIYSYVLICTEDQNCVLHELFNGSNGHIYDVTTIIAWTSTLIVALFINTKIDGYLSKPKKCLNKNSSFLMEHSEKTLTINSEIDRSR